MPLQQGGMSLAARQPLELLHLLPMPPFASKVKMQQWLPAQVSALGKARQWRRELRRPRPRRPFGGQCRHRLVQRSRQRPDRSPRGGVEAPLQHTL